MYCFNIGSTGEQLSTISPRPSLAARTRSGEPSGPGLLLSKSEALSVETAADEVLGAGFLPRWISVLIPEDELRRLEEGPPDAWTNCIGVGDRATGAVGAFL